MNKTTVLIVSMLTCPLGLFAEGELSGNAPAATLAAEKIIGPALEKFSANLSLGYESEYIFRGVKLADAVISPALDVEYDAGYGLGLYAGVFNATSVKGDSYNEVDVYAGVTYSIASFVFDVGYIGYLYPNEGGNTHEIKFGVSYDTSALLGEFNVSPSFAYYYDFTLGVSTFEVGLEYSAPVTKWIIGSEWGSLDLAAVYGFITPNTEGHDYGYVALSADAVVAVNDWFSLSAGMRYSHKSGGGEGDTNNLWFGTSASFGF